MINKNFGFVVKTVLSGFVLFLMVALPLGYSAEEADKETAENDQEAVIETVYSDLETFANALTIIDRYYVEETPPKDLVYGALKGVLGSLDPYSQFLDPDDYKEIQVETEGKFGGIGVEITFRDGILTIISPVDDTPAESAGVAPGDKIVRIDGTSTRRLNLDDAVKLLRGKPGTKVDITVLREGEGRLLDFEITRAIINVKSIREAQVLADNVGYLRLSEFQENTPYDLAQALKSIEDKDIEGLIFDLRNNPGGLLSVAVEVAELFVPRGELIVYTKGRDKEQDMRFESKGILEPRSYPIVVLVNHGSASASEIVAGAIRDHRLGIILGEKTFGKGSVQTVIPMRDGSAIRLTTSKYFTPSGKVIHGEGIEPDVSVPYKSISSKPESKDAKKNKISEVFNKVKEMSKIEDVDGEEDKTLTEGLDNQIVRAIDLIRALNVYGVYTLKENKEKTS